MSCIVASELVPAIVDVRDSLDEINRTLKEIAKRLAYSIKLHGALTNTTQEIEMSEILDLCDVYFSCPDAPGGPTLHKLERVKMYQLEIAPHRRPCQPSREVLLRAHRRVHQGSFG